jgi:hypothetical protein
VEDEALLVFSTGVVVEMLFFVSWGKGGDGKRLGLATGENGGTVDAWQGADFAVKRAKVTDAAAVGAHAFLVCPAWAWTSRMKRDDRKK